jgi:hypothetical protein
MNIEDIDSIILPKLTDLIYKSSDPEIRPFSIIMKHYPFPTTTEKKTLPAFVKLELS